MGRAVRASSFCPPSGPNKRLYFRAHQVPPGESFAKKTALAKENGTIKEAELEKEKGKLVYSFDIDVKGAIHEVQVEVLGAFD